METYFKLSDFLRVRHNGEWHYMPTPNQSILDQIVENHFIPINKVRDYVGKPLVVNRGYATVKWEKERGRSGTSQHCYPQNGYDELGATDIDYWKPNKGAQDYIKLAQGLIDSPFKRICWYPEMTFFHNDYNSHERQYFWYDGKWHYIGNDPDEFKDKIRESFNG